jgi:hypothetical protein
MNKLIDLYKSISMDTWDRLEFANKTDSSFSETTATENLLYSINKYKITNGDNSILMFESKNEQANGDDLEVYLEIGDNKYIYLAIQAKKLYTKIQKYRAISHKVNSCHQIDLLLKYAKLKRGIPLYLLYNYAPNFKNKNKKNYGCSIAKANYIYNNFYPKSSSRWKIPSFDNLHTKNAIPLYLLGNNRCFNKFIGSYCRKLKLYNDSELIDNSWIQIESLKYKIDEIKDEIIESKTFVNDSNKQLNLSDDDKKSFTPKFKVILKNIDNKTEERNE